MLSLSAFLAGLPPAALAETDLPRFCALVLGRRARSELPGLALLLAEETLRGYPAGLPAILRAVIGQILEDDLEVELVDASSIERLFGRAPFLRRLGELTDLRRERLRPGTIVGPELRLVAGRRLQVIGSHGTQLALVYPVDLARVPDAHFAVPRGPVLAMEMETAEIEVLRETWIAVEGATGLDGAEARRWTARFFAIARRPGIDVASVQKAIVRMSPELRAHLSEALVAHNRDGALPEHHRPGPRGLERRLARLGVELDAPWTAAATALVSEVFASAAPDPMVERGYCSVPPEDLALWSEWVEVPAAARAAVTAIAPPEIEEALMRLAEVEDGRVDEELDPTLRRGLQSLRDHCLRPRWLRSRAALDGLDLLRVCDTWLARGDDLSEKIESLQKLAVEAAVVSEERALVETARIAAESARLALVNVIVAGPPRAPEIAPGKRTLATAPEDEDNAIEPVSQQRAAAPSEHVESGPAPLMDSEQAQPKPGVEAASELGAPWPAPPVKAAAGAADLAIKAPPASPSSTPPAAVRVERVPTASRFELPPMPKPPPMRTRPVTGLPIPVIAPPTAPKKATPASAAPPRPAPAPSPVVEAAPRVVRRVPTLSPASKAAPSALRSSIASHLMTPAQAHAFYEESFRELEVIERDVLRGGHSASVGQRLDVIATDATAIIQALGPSARSGDREFQVAIERMERVEHYLLRIRALELDEVEPRRERPKSFWKRLLGDKEGP